MKRVYQLRAGTANADGHTTVSCEIPRGTITAIRFLDVDQHGDGRFNFSLVNDGRNDVRLPLTACADGVYFSSPYRIARYARVVLTDGDAHSPGGAELRLELDYDEITEKQT